MEPIEVTPDSKKGYVITFRCTKCGAIKNNKMADDDDYNLILNVAKFHASNIKIK